MKVLKFSRAILKVHTMRLTFMKHNIFAMPLPGDHLREVRPALYGPGPATGGAELPGHRHPQSHDAGGQVGGRTSY